jgi:signal peptidase II
VQAVGGATLNGDDPTATGPGIDADAGPDIGQDEPGTPPVPARRGRPVALLAAAAVVVLIIDILTKQWAVAALTDRPPVKVLGGLIYLLLVRNSGAAFSLGTGYTFVFPVITLAVVGWILWTARRLRSLPWALALGLVLGGALGNFTDRLFRAPGPMVGHVVDFVSLLNRGGTGFPVFNMADSALCVGVGLAVLLELTGRRIDGTRTTHAGTREAARTGVSDSAGG